MVSAASVPGPLERVAAHFPLFADLPQSLRERLARELRVTVAPRGTRLFDEHSPCGAFPLILEGRVRVVKLAPNGREILLYRVEAGQSCVLSSGCLLGHVDYAATGIADTDVTIAILPKALFDALIAGHPPFRTHVFSLLSARIAELMMLVEEVAFHRLDQRLAAILLARGPTLETSHQSLADELGSVREIVSRLLNGFEDRSMVTLGRNRIRVTDAVALRRIAGPV